MDASLMKKLNTQLMQRLKDANGRNANLEARIAALEARLVSAGPGSSPPPSSSPQTGAPAHPASSPPVQAETPVSALPPTSPASTKESPSPRDDLPSPPAGPLFGTPKQALVRTDFPENAVTAPRSTSLVAAFFGAIKAFFGRFVSAFQVLIGTASVTEGAPLLSRAARGSLVAG